MCHLANSILKLGENFKSLNLYQHRGIVNLLKSGEVQAKMGALFYSQLNILGANKVIWLTVHIILFQKRVIYIIALSFLL